MGVRLGKLIKAARTDAGFTQEQLAKKVRGVTTAEIGKYERGEAEPTQETVKTIAKVCGVTQKSLLDAMPKSKTSSSSRTSTSTATKTSMQVTSTERTLVELYRRASSEDKKKALSVLRGNNSDLGDILEGIGNILGDALKK